ncbi:MAG: sodium-dependent transporter [Gammaproteobacteria bacterium]
MATKRTSLHGLWSSRLAFILAVSGSAVGLGNIWKFPYVAGDNGGGAFVLFYLLCVVLIGLPIMISEILIGRRGRRNPVATMRLVGEEEGSRPSWALVGIMGVVAGIIILSFYSVVAGWSLRYVGHAVTGAFTGATPEYVTGLFGGLLGSWQQLLFWHTVFMVMTVLVVARGVERGLEKAVRFLMPALAVLMVALLAYAIIEGDFAGAVAFLLEADFSKLTGDAMLAAMGQAFFSLSVGMGAIMAYGAYLPEGTSITNTSFAVVVADTAMALLAGLAIFPIVFANGLAPDSGPGLIFQTLPLAFGNMGGGLVFGTLFFVLLTFAAWTSSIGLIEPAVAWSVETHGWSRAAAATVLGAVVWVLGLATVLSFNVLADFRILGRTLFENLDHLASNVMRPLGGFFITLFAGWVMCKPSTADELDIGTGALYRTWRFLARWVAPAAVLAVFLHATGLLKLSELLAP